MKRIAPFAPPHLACWIIREVAAGAGADRTGPWYENGQILSPRSKPTRALRELITRNEYQAPGFYANADTIETSWNTPLSPRFRESYRSKLEVEIVAPAKGCGNVRARSWMALNNNRRDPGDAGQADWVGAGVADRHPDRSNEPAMKLPRMLNLRSFGLNA